MSILRFGAFEDKNFKILKTNNEPISKKMFRCDTNKVGEEKC